MSSVAIRNALMISDSEMREVNLYLQNGIIHSIDPISKNRIADITLEAKGQIVVPGVIDDQVHFREPGLTHKGNLFTESRAAAAGGITSYMEMPNTVPSAVTVEELEKKYARAAEVSLVNYSFFMGTTNRNLQELLKVDYAKVCGIKIFMGSSTGDMLVDDPQALEAIFEKAPALIATHCEFDPWVKENAKRLREEFGDSATAAIHPRVRDAEACYRSSSFAVDLAKKHNSRLHILHISTEKELSLFSNEIPLDQKRITAEACIHHLWFTDADYEKQGNRIKWNPAVKSEADKNAIWRALLDNRIDVIATDHAPHTLDEKSKSYWDAPSGGPLVQHSLQAMMDCVDQGKISWIQLVEKMCHNPAVLFRIPNRGFIREGYAADIVLTEDNPQTVTTDSLLYLCKWSPFEGHTFNHRVKTTLVNGSIVWNDGKIIEQKAAQRLQFSTSGK